MSINWLILFARNCLYICLIHWNTCIIWTAKTNLPKPNALLLISECYCFTAQCSSSPECHTHDFSFDIYSRLRIPALLLLLYTILQVLVWSSMSCFSQIPFVFHIFCEHVLWVKHFALQKVMCLRGGVEICK